MKRTMAFFLVLTCFFALFPYSAAADGGALGLDEAEKTLRIAEDGRFLSTTAEIMTLTDEILRGEHPEIREEEPAFSSEEMADYASYYVSLDDCSGIVLSGSLRGEDPGNSVVDSVSLSQFYKSEDDPEAFRTLAATLVYLALDEADSWESAEELLQDAMENSGRFRPHGALELLYEDYGESGMVMLICREIEAYR